MKFETVEIRSEEEFIGNILWIIHPKDKDGLDAALMSLWIEAQEYNSDYDATDKESEYKIEEKSFLYSEMTVGLFKSKMQQFLKKIYSSKNSSLFKTLINGENVKSRIEPPKIDGNSKIYILESSDTDFVAVITKPEEYLLFCWTDVA